MGRQRHSYAPVGVQNTRYGVYSMGLATKFRYTFSRDPAAVKFMDDDPLIAHEAQPTRTVAQLVLADERLKREFNLIKLPILIMHGIADKVTKPGGSQFFFDQAGSVDKTLKLYDNHAHDLLNDVGREGVMNDILQWLDRHSR